jgi:hypothetical protein
MKRIGMKNVQLKLILMDMGSKKNKKKLIKKKKLKN